LLVLAILDCRQKRRSSILRTARETQLIRLRHKDTRKTASCTKHVLAAEAKGKYD